MEPAKLALVTSKDEEDDIEQTATDSSNDTDATLVKDSAPRAGGTRTGGTGSPVGSPGASSSSVLGKRARDKEVVASRMSIDSDNFVIISKIPDVADADAAGPSRADEMKDAEAPAQSGAKPPPPLPQRKTSESVMMFGALIIRRLGYMLMYYYSQDDNTTSRSAWTTASSRSRLPCSNSTGWTSRKMESRAW
jgi:hypothetical protein